MSGGLYEYVDKNEDQPALFVNGQAMDIKPEVGYAVIERKWMPGDQIDLQLPMPARRVSAHSGALEDRDMVALERGPIVDCCLEWPENNGHALNVVVPDDAAFKTAWRGDLLNGVTVIRSQVEALDRDRNNG